MNSKETIELVKKMVEDGNLSEEVAVKYCPELEDEDERIKKQIIGFITYSKILNETKKNWLAWLKKQKATTFNKDIEKIRNAAIYACKYMVDNFENSTKQYEDAIAWLEKQGGQKESYDTCVSTPLNDKKTPYGEKRDFGYFKKQDEKKPADKVEPKFKVGDWIIHNTNPDLIYYVESILSPQSDCYCLEHNSGTRLMNFSEDNDYYLWTIQDAKAGDVLSYRDGQWCFIYKGIVTEDTFKYYALLSEKGITVNDAAFSLLTSCIIPATKEQRDTLIKAMANAGYTFDFEKKELKKIEDKPIVIDEGKAEMDRNFTGMMLKDYTKQNTWSEEDEIMFRKAIITIDNVRMDTGLFEYYQGISKWLESIKDRVQSQPRQEWKPSEEQLKSLQEG